jgi:7-cyano-7-deazaguanine tRNA-ribosyltransferase
LTEGGTPTDSEYDAVWKVVPPFGPFPGALSDTYPLNAQVPDRLDDAARRTAAAGVAALAEANPEASLTLAHDGWSASVLDEVPTSVTLESLSSVANETGEDTDELDAV